MFFNSYYDNVKLRAENKRLKRKLLQKEKSMTSINDKIDQLTAIVTEIAAHQDVTSNQTALDAIAKIQTSVDTLNSEVGVDDSTPNNTPAPTAPVATPAPTTAPDAA